MRVNNKQLTTIWFEEETREVKIIDQRLLPHELKIVILKNLEDILIEILF